MSVTNPADVIRDALNQLYLCNDASNCETVFAALAEMESRCVPVLPDRVYLQELRDIGEKLFVVQLGDINGFYVSAAGPTIAAACADAIAKIPGAEEGK